MKALGWYGSRLFTLLVIGVILAACQTPTPEAHPTITRLASLAPSPTVLPIASPQETTIAVGHSDPTSAALALEGEPSSEAPLAPLPTQAIIPIVVQAPDGTLLQAAYYGAPIQPAPAVLLLHGETGDLSHLEPVAAAIQNAGYNVMLLSGRGYGTSSGERDWTSTATDAQAALETLQTLPITPQIALLAEGRSASVAVTLCMQQPLCPAVMLLNPLVDSLGTPLEQLVVNGAMKPLWVAAGQDQPTSLQLAQTLGNGVLQAYSSLDAGDFIPVLLSWLQGYLKST